MSRERGRRLRRGALPLGVPLLVLAAVVIGMFLPSVFSGIQSFRLEGLKEVPDLGAGELSLTSDDIKIERLALPQMIQIKEEMGMPVDYLELTAGRFMDAGSAADKLEELELLLQDTGLKTGSVSRKDLCWAQPILVMTDGGGAAGTVVWQLRFYRETGPVSESLGFMVDESTGLIVCAEYNIVDQRELESGESVYAQGDRSGNYLQTLSSLAENMKKSYNFAQTEVEPQHIEGELSPFQDVFYIYFVQNEEVRLSMPIWIEENHWAINVQ